MTKAVRLNHVSICVRELKRSADFYRNALGLVEIECGARKPNIRWFGLGDGQSLHLIEAPFDRTFVTMSTHFCISSEDFEQSLEDLRTRNICYYNLAREPGQQHIRADGVRSVYLQDPDEYWIEINEDY